MFLDIKEYIQIQIQHFIRHTWPIPLYIEIQYIENKNKTNKKSWNIVRLTNQRSWNFDNWKYVEFFNTIWCAFKNSRMVKHINMLWESIICRMGVWMKGLKKIVAYLILNLSYKKESWMNCLLDLTWLSFDLNFALHYLIIKRITGFVPSFCKGLLNYTFKLGYFRRKILWYPLGFFLRWF